MKIYKLSDEYLRVSVLKGKLLERAKKKRFRAISPPGIDGATRVFELNTGYRSTYHKDYLSIEGDEMNKYKEALEDMVWQFGHKDVEDKKSIIWTGGLSALEQAFKALSWDDPHYVEDYDGGICDVDGCAGWVVAQGGMWQETGYWCLCGKHSQSYRDGKPKPRMKQRAIDREASRGLDRCLSFKATK